MGRVCGNSTVQLFETSKLLFQYNLVSTYIPKSSHTGIVHSAAKLNTFVVTLMRFFFIATVFSVLVLYIYPALIKQIYSSTSNLMFGKLNKHCV